MNTHAAPDLEAWPCAGFRMDGNGWVVGANAECLAQLGRPSR